MNLIPGVVFSITSDDTFANINIVCENSVYSVCTLCDEQMLFYHIGSQVVMAFKETDTLICMQPDYLISCQNRFISTISHIDYGPVVSKIITDCHGFSISSIITSSSARSLDLSVGNEVICMVKSTSILLR